jgi:excisionase family DNA binding protein
LGFAGSGVLSALPDHFVFTSPLPMTLILFRHAESLSREIASCGNIYFVYIEAMGKSDSDIIGTAEAAEALDITARQVQNLIADGLLPARKIGRDYVIIRSDLNTVPKDRKPGPKPKEIRSGK